MVTASLQHLNGTKATRILFSYFYLLTINNNILSISLCASDAPKPFETHTHKNGKYLKTIFGKLRCKLRSVINQLTSHNKIMYATPISSEMPSLSQQHRWTLITQVQTGLMRYMMSYTVFCFHKNRYQVACNFSPCHCSEHYLRPSESCLWACWGQDIPDFLADCWKEKAIISCHFRARKCSTITPEHNNPQSVSLLRPPGNKCLNWHCWKRRLKKTADK